MSKEVLVKKEITLSGTQSGTIKVGSLQEPYGKDSDSVVTIAVSLNNSESDWKVHIPYPDLDKVIQALEDIKK